MQTIPRPWSVTSFIGLLLNYLHDENVSPEIKTSILQAVQQLLKEQSTVNISSISSNLLQYLQYLLTPTTPGSAAEKNLLIAEILKLLFYLNRLDPYFVALLMYCYSVVQGSLIPAMILDYFQKCGVKDPLGYFPKEILKMEKPSLSDEYDGQGYTKSLEWLDHWAGRLAAVKTTSKNVLARKQSSKLVQ